MNDRRPERPFVVLQSFPSPRPTTNPYIVMLAESLSALPDVELRTFTWREALTARVDVFHAHWPEILVGGRTVPRRAVRQTLFALVLLRLALFRTPLVRTIHNQELPRGLSAPQRLLLRLAERRTALWIRLNEHTTLPAGAVSETIPHGHYRDWFSRYPRSEACRGRVAFVGQIRRYKGVDHLIRAFAGTRGPLELVIAGSPTSDDLAELVRTLAAEDPRVTLDLRFLPDADLVTAITSAQLVVLPYPEMHNSGAVLAALSLDRPVLVPDNEVNRELAQEVGRDWLVLYRGELSAATLEAALAAPEHHGTAAPALAGRGWERTGQSHLAAYRRAVALLRHS